MFDLSHGPTHELAHGVTACLSLLRFDAKHYSSMMVNLWPRSMNLRFEAEVPKDLRDRVHSLTAIGPLALLPQEEMRLAMKRQSLEDLSLLSEADFLRLSDAALTRHEYKTAVYATADFLIRHKKQIKRVGEMLEADGEIHILAPLLVPRDAALKANVNGGLNAWTF
ncbi:hypothetical protein [Paracoccus sp. KR1-242]|uniref:hypothetical protein n=1 Tax=Paracoccus sp. KR1-242 TaxID=3410028 RepID=UPI003C10480F